ncbi:hypothetical protein BJ912DRAFT_847445 [Pholiota molesta]|nr:hypothetical protein BJ912DRAFT_847445 [Pholiota molesta]
MQLNTHDNASPQPSNISSFASFVPPTTPPRPSYERTLAPNPTPSPPQPHLNGGSKIIPIAIQKTGKIYHVLRLTPPNLSNGQESVQILHDPILPPPTAFRDSEFPSFYNSTWQHIFERVVNPVALWEVYAPKNLGDYNNMGDLWQAWDEGSFVEGVGRLPALRLIEARWGTLKNQETNKGKYAAWRPHKNDRVRKIWGNFYFFVSRIRALEATGSSSIEAVAHFEGLRGTRSLNQLHRSLQEKKRSREEEAQK